MAVRSKADPTTSAYFREFDVVFAFVCVMSLAAYRQLAWSLSSAPGGEDVGGWLFAPSLPATAPAIAVSIWIAARRWKRLRELQRDTSAPLAAILFAISLACFARGAQTESADLLLLSIAGHALAVAAMLRGRNGMHAMIAPVVVIALGIQIPPPLENEWIWQLQLQTARDTQQLVQWLGSEVSRAGVMLWSGSVRFQVIEGCSGMRGMRILVFVAFVVGELFSNHDRPRASAIRVWALVAVALMLAYLLNVVRVALIVMMNLGESNAVAESHTVQGVVVLVAGSVLLYLVGFAIARPLAGLIVADSHRQPQIGRTRTAIGHRRLAILIAAFQLVVSFVAPWLNRGAASRSLATASLPANDGRWNSEVISPSGHDAFFFGNLPMDEIVFRRYSAQHPHPQNIEVMIIPDRLRYPDTARLFTTKLQRPGPHYRIVETGPIEIWALETSATRTLVAKEDSVREGALVYSWHIRDAGIWRESLDAMLGSRRVRSANSPERIAVRLATAVALDRRESVEEGRRTLERFIASMRDSLRAL